LEAAAIMKLIPYPPRNRAVDFLRGIAIGIVMLLHARIGGAAYSRPVIVPPALLNPPAYNGLLGVCLFFVISGYVITAFALRRDGEFRRVRIGQFYLFRASRIFPPLLTLILLNLTCRALGCWGFGLNGISVRQLLTALFTFRFNLLYLAGGALLPAWAMLWSLSVEETFYLLFPLLARAVRSPGLIVAILIGLVIEGPFYRHAYGWGALYEYWGCFDQLALGCLVAIASRHWRAQTWSRGIRRAFQAVGFSLFVAICYGGDLHQRWGAVLMPSGVALGAALFLLGSPLEGLPAGGQAPARARWAAAAWPVCFLGFLSYELYLFYAPILLLLRGPLQALVKATGGFMPKDIMVAILVAGCAVLCGLLHTWVNERILRWTRGGRGAGRESPGPSFA
jgi:peptidoglycan/LPS O-acetylase OafA/YrhL